MIGGGGGAKRVIYDALLGNLGIAMSKLVAATLTDITSMWAETYHSFADTFNQVLFLIGVRTNKKRVSDNTLLGIEKDSFFSLLLWPHSSLVYLE